MFKSCADLRHAECLYTRVIRQSAEPSLAEIQGEAYHRRGETFARQSRWHDATADLRRSRQLFDPADNALVVGRIDNILGTIAVEQGNMRKARELFKRALGTFKRSQKSTMMGKVLMNLGIVQNILGRYDAALDSYEQARPFFEEADDQVRLANRSMDQFVMVNDHLSIADAYKVKGMIYREMKRFDLAELYLMTSLRLNLELGNQLNAGESSFEIPILEKARENWNEALEALENVRAYFIKVGARTEMLCSLELIGQIKES